MAHCACGAPVWWGVTEDGTRIRLDAVGSFAGPRRFRVINYQRDPWVVEEVRADLDVSAYQEHRLTCPRS